MSSVDNRKKKLVRYGTYELNLPLNSISYSKKKQTIDEVIQPMKS